MLRNSSSIHTMCNKNSNANYKSDNEDEDEDSDKSLNEYMRKRWKT